jgi:hypothetical protein
MATTILYKPLLGGVGSEDSDSFLLYVLFAKKMSETEDKIGFGRIVVAATSVLSLLFAAVVEEEDVTTAH